MLSLCQIAQKIGSKGKLYSVYKSPSRAKIEIWEKIESEHDYIFIVSYNCQFFSVGALDKKDDGIYFTRITPTKERTIKLSEVFING